MDEATRICARLLREGSVPRAALPDLDFPEVRSEVERRFQDVGLVLATSVYSEHVGIRLAPEVTADTAFDAASNLGLRSDACALLVILWARLVLQKRTAAETREVPGQSALFDRGQAAAARGYRPRVRLEALVREFRPVLGGRSRIQSLVTQLRRLGFLAGHGEQIEAGPLLELAIDGERMVAFLRREVLAKLLAEREQPGGESEDGAGEAAAEQELLAGAGGRVLAALARLGGSAAMGDLARLTEAPASRLRRVLRDLEAGGRVRRTGERASARYHLADLADLAQAAAPAGPEDGR
jgi:DNA-binding MarR family transcriptional regulator